MKTLEIEELLAVARRAQLLPPPSAQLPPACAQTPPSPSAETYENIVVSIINFCEASQMAERTHALAKSYLDICLERKDLVANQHLELMAMICIWQAVEVNEPRQKASQYNANTIHLTLNGLFHIDQITALKLTLEAVLQSNHGFPELLALRQQLPDLLNFALTLHALRRTCAEELFFGALLASLQISGWALTSSQRADLGSLIVNKADCEAVSAKIVEEYTKVLGET